MSDARDRIEASLREHERLRTTSLNLIAAENVMSPAVHAALDSDLVHRYGDYLGRDLTARKYFGNRHLVEIEHQVHALAREVFGAAFVEPRPLSGHVAGSAVIMALTTPGARVMELGSDGGGHRLAEKLSVAPLTPLHVEFLPFDGERYNIDAGTALEAIERFQPSLVILGSSNFLFPHPVRELASGLPRGTTLVYDASHVMGLLAGGGFQNPLAEGASVVFGSTHKTFPGPPGGIIFANDEAVIERISSVVYPGLVTNHHPARMPALALALAEMREWGHEYAAAVVRNAARLGAELQAKGLRIVGARDGYTRSHTLLVATAEHGSGAEIGARLESAGIITNAAKLPPAWDREGIRLGVQELTRRGIDDARVRRVAELIAGVVRGTVPNDRARRDVADLASTLQGIRYGWGRDG